MSGRAAALRASEAALPVVLPATSVAILVVESDVRLGRGIVEQLTADGYRAQLARTAQHARILARSDAPGLVVIGDLDSRRATLELLTEVRLSDGTDARWRNDVPVIVVSSWAQELDLLRAFEAGADDFLARPARYLELRARLRALLRRAERTTERRRTLRVGPLVIAPGARIASLHGRAVDLRRLEFQLLLHLAAEPDRVFTREELLRAVWGYRSSGATRTVDSHASRLRRKLGSDRGERWVINVWGVGYRLI